MDYTDKTNTELIKELQDLKHKYEELKISYNKDISARYQAEEVIRKMGQHYRALIDKAPDGILLIDTTKNII